MPRLRAPFRLRPSRRTILLACILLLAGAIVNVAVAWVLVGAPDSWTRGGVVSVSSSGGYTPENRSPGEVEQRAMARRLRMPDSWILASGYEVRGLGWTLICGVGSGARAGFRADGGWPTRSMTLLTTQPNLFDREYSFSVEPPRDLLPSAEWFPEERDRIPLMPIPAGFALNTLFYAAILALPLSFFPIRRRLRARRGRCPACGYDLAGAPAPGGGGGSVCPECGARRRNVAPPPLPPQAEGLDRK